MEGKSSGQREQLLLFTFSNAQYTVGACPSVSVCLKFDKVGKSLQGLSACFKLPSQITKLFSVEIRSGSSGAASIAGMIMTEQWLQDSANEGCEAICIIAMEKVLQEEVKFQHSVLEYLGY